MGWQSRNLVLDRPHGRVDYLLLVDGQPVGVIEAKPVRTPLKEVGHQSGRYIEGIPAEMKKPLYPLPFIYDSTGTETRFTNGYDPVARSRRVFTFHRPETLAQWARQIAENSEAPTFRARLKAMPPLDERGLRDYQAEVIRKTEEALAEDKQRVLVQMAQGSGKVFTATNLSYRLIRHAGARRILFLVDRRDVASQTKLQFDEFTIPETQRKFAAEYNVQDLTTSTVDAASRVCISTIQRVFSILTRPGEVSYNQELPPDAFDVIIVDECHRSIYGPWQQVLGYFDAQLVGLTATPNKQALEYFEQNLVVANSFDKAFTHGQSISQDLWNYYDVLRNEGLSYQDYLEQLTFLLFLKMADEQAKRPLNRQLIIPHGLDWESLVGLDGDSLEMQYRHILTELGKYPGTLGVVFRKAQNKIHDPAKLRRLVDLIGRDAMDGAGCGRQGRRVRRSCSRRVPRTSSQARGSTSRRAR